MRYFYFFLTLIIFTGCKKDRVTAEFKGTYTGRFTAYRTNQIVSDTEIAFSGNRFEFKKGFKGGSGTFKVLNETRVEFEDENFWTAEFDWALILSGDYKYEIKGDSLILTREVPQSNSVNYRNYLYQYRLKKTTDARQPEL